MKIINAIKNYSDNKKSESNDNYTWHLEPTIEAEDIMATSDEYNKKQWRFIIDPYDECAIIKQDGKYGIIKYDGSYIAESKYNKYFAMSIYEMSIFNEV